MALRHSSEIVRTAWIVEHQSDTARLVTLYIRRRQ
ncbi:DUF6883 domain-containing protein [Iningainema tapete]